MVRNLPVAIQSIRRFAAAARGKQVDGILGTVLLYHFLATIDYPNGELVLHRRPPARPEPGPKDIEVPFWLAGDHLMVVWGREPPAWASRGPSRSWKKPAFKLAPGTETEGASPSFFLGAARETDFTGGYGTLPETLDFGEGDVVDSF
ncbi:MAG: hypothetical protein WAM82_08280 [Thermoanaerobaculia bacterium]